MQEQGEGLTLVESITGILYAKEDIKEADEKDVKNFGDIGRGCAPRICDLRPPQDGAIEAGLSPHRSRCCRSSSAHPCAWLYVLCVTLLQCLPPDRGNKRRLWRGWLLMMFGADGFGSLAAPSCLVSSECWRPVDVLEVWMDKIPVVVSRSAK